MESSEGHFLQFGISGRIEQGLLGSDGKKEMNPYRRLDYESEHTWVDHIGQSNMCCCCEYETLVVVALYSLIGKQKIAG